MSRTDSSTLSHGILLVNKSQGLSSNAVLQRVKGLLGVKKAGHTGSLDPLATGMLPICIGEATKLSQYLLDADKCYQTTGLLGIKTDSSDSTGKPTVIVENFECSKTMLETVISEFKGITKQTPSMFSALKHQGKPLYKYAREGIDIERPAREVRIDQLKLASFDGHYFSLTVTCSKGTYIRNLVEDMGDRLGFGAHVTALHRCFTSGFEDHVMYTLDELQEMNHAERLSCVLPLDKAVIHLPALSLSEDETLSIRQGKRLHIEQKPFLGTLRLYSDSGAFVGMGELTDGGELKAKRLFAEPIKQ